MKKMIYLMNLLILIVSGCGKSQTNQFDEQKKISPQDKIKFQVKNYTYYAINRVNSQGYVEYVKPLDKTKLIKNYVRLAWNDKNQVFKEEEYESTKMVRYSIFSYQQRASGKKGDSDKKNNVLTSENSFDEQHRLIFTRTYNHNKRISKECFYSSGEMIECVVYHYSPSNNNYKIELKNREDHFNPDSQLQFYILFDYNSKNKLISQSLYSPKGTLVLKTPIKGDS